MYCIAIYPDLLYQDLLWYVSDREALSQYTALNMNINAIKSQK